MSLLAACLLTVLVPFRRPASTEWTGYVPQKEALQLPSTSSATALCRSRSRSVTTPPPVLEPLVLGLELVELPQIGPDLGGSFPDGSLHLDSIEPDGVEVKLRYRLSPDYPHIVVGDPQPEYRVGRREGNCRDADPCRTSDL